MKLNQTNQILERLKSLPTATIYSAVKHFGFDPCWMKGVHTYTPSQKLVGQAQTLRFVPPRADILKETKLKENSPEYQAMGSTGPGKLIVMDAMGKDWASIGGDVKLLQLKINGAEGLVTDGAVRDLDAVKSYGFPIFASGRTGAVGEPDIHPFEAGGTIQCGGVVVRPGDFIIGDDDGVVVVYSEIVKETIEWAEKHESYEEFAKSLIESEKVAPGKYYPINEKLLDSLRNQNNTQ